MDPKPRTSEEVEALIYEAFADVRLGDGISWSESEDLDLCFPHEDRNTRCTLDDHAPWQELVDNPNWRISSHGGGFSFLDAAGHAYYLPATIIRVLRGMEDDFLLYFYLNLAGRADSDDVLEQWSFLNDEQTRAVAIFLRHMIQADEKFSEYWRKAYRSYWKSFDPDPLK